MDLALPFLEQIADRRRIDSVRLLFDRQDLARQQRDRLRHRRRSHQARRPRRGSGGTISTVVSPVSGAEIRKRELRGMSTLLLIAEDHFDGEVLGQQARLVAPRRRSRRFRTPARPCAGRRPT